MVSFRDRPDVSEEHEASIVRVEEPNKKPAEA
jgi:hypothetical protein